MEFESTNKRKNVWEKETVECMRNRNDGGMSNSRFQRWSENRGDGSQKEWNNPGNARVLRKGILRRRTLKQAHNLYTK